MFAASIEARPWLLYETETGAVSPGTCSVCELAGCPPEADVHAPRPGSSAGPRAGIVP